MGLMLSQLQESACLCMRISHYLDPFGESPWITKKNRKSNDVLQVMKLCNVVSYCMYSTLHAICIYLVLWTIATSCMINHAELQSSHFALAFADDADRWEYELLVSVITIFDDFIVSGQNVQRLESNYWNTSWRFLQNSQQRLPGNQDVIASKR